MTVQPAIICTCPSGDGSLRYPCPVHANECTAQPAAAQEAVALVDGSVDHGDAGVSITVVWLGKDGAPEIGDKLFRTPVTAAPVVPKARITEPLRADESRQEQADNAIYNRGWNDCRAAMLASTPAAPGIDLIDASPKGGSGALREAAIRARRCLAWACQQRPEFNPEYEALNAALQATSHGAGVSG